jgi:hypothetical protein
MNKKRADEHPNFFKFFPFIILPFIMSVQSLTEPVQFCPVFFKKVQKNCLFKIVPTTLFSKGKKNTGS